MYLLVRMKGRHLRTLLSHCEVMLSTDKAAIALLQSITDTRREGGKREGRKK